MEEAVSDFKAWYFKIPLFTRYYLTACFVVTVMISLAIVSPYSLTYTFRSAFMQFQIWRPFTAAVFMGKFSFGTIFQMYYAYLFLNKTQTEIFTMDRYQDFIWCMSFFFISLVIFNSILPTYVYTNAFLMAVTYVFCKRRPHEEFRLMFGLKVKSGIFPFVYAGISVLLFGSSFMPFLMGLGLGHLYIYLKDILPVQTHKDYLATPQFIRKLWYGYGMPQRAPTNTRNNADQPRNIFAGRGVRIE